MTMSMECPTCLNFIGYNDDNVPTCRAFPEGIPDDIISGETSHVGAYKGDNGIRYERGLGDDDI